MDFVADGPQGARELRVSARYMPATVDKDNSRLGSGHRCSAGFVDIIDNGYD